MTERMLVAVGTALLVAGSALAQGPQVLPPPLSSQVVPPAPAAAAAPAASESSDFWETGWGGGADGQFWLSAEYLLGWFSGDRLPPLVTASPAGTARGSAGVIGGPTAYLFGGRVVNDDLRNGGRLAAGYWVNPERTFGVEVGFLLLESQTTGFAAASNGSPILARPFFDVATGVQASELIAFPGSSTGSVAARASSGNLLMATVDLTENVVDAHGFRLDSLFGYRFYSYGEGVSVRQVNTNIPNAPGAVFTGEDDFGTNNTFHGGDFGLRMNFAWENFSLGLLSKLAVGRVSRDVKIVGANVTTSPGLAPAIRAGDILTLPTNLGFAHADDWALVPELGATLGWQATPNVRVTVGYSVLWLDRVARAADQIDLSVNGSLFPTSTEPASTANRPAFLGIRNDVCFQTLNFGLELTY